MQSRRHTWSRPGQIILQAGLLVGALGVIGYLAWQQRLLTHTVPILRVDYPDQPIRVQDWDPARSTMDFEVAMVQALYSPLLELDDNAQLKPGWAQHFYWRDPHTMVLELRRDHRRADGALITAADAARSLKRLAFLQQDEDPFYVLQFCQQKLTSMQADCPGLIAEDQTLTIHTQDPVAILPQLLTTADTSIVPITDLAADGLTLIEHPVGSGPYSRVTTAPDQVALKANPHHFNYSAHMPQDIQLIAGTDATPDKLAQDFRSHRIDHAARFSALNAFEFRKLASTVGKDANQQLTLPMGVGLLLFSEAGRTRFSVAERQELVLRIQAATGVCLNKAGQDQIRRPTKVLIPPTGVGMLTAMEAADLEVARRLHESVAVQQPVRIRFPKYIGEQIIPCFTEEMKDLPLAFAVTGEEEVDLRFKSYDMSTYEELGSIRSLLSAGALDAGDLNPENWISRYIAEADTHKRVAYLKNSHRRAIWDDPLVITLWNFETGALIRKPWVMKFSPLSISNPFHLIRYEE